MKSIRVGLLLDFYAPLLTDKQRELLDLHYNQDFSLAEIGEAEGVSRQAVLDTVRRGETALTKLEEKLGLMRRYRSMCGLVEECLEMNRQGRSSELDEKLKKMLALWEDHHGV
ncbi:MAG: YlxM family DNA-binding protein [Christensenellales bacterium]